MWAIGSHDIKFIF
ncbi:hypothetical protein Ahy_B09g095332 isoform B [Arachis hypogaea]|uniref:Uncharacterized protein n=2 Tax=Pentapetalae TaxID=1437201 RepID=A0A444XDH5_ARAHY|nr:hypothetical protein Ahy_B09g095332 isoform B [Arachis hypogaea]